MLAVTQLSPRIKSSASAPAKRTGTQSIERAVRVLRVLATDPGEGIRVTEVAAHLGLEVATAHRILKALVSAGLAEHSASRRYRLGPLIFELGIAATPDVNFVAVCEPSVARIAKATGDVAMLIVRSGVDTVCMDRREGSFPIRTLTQHVGTRRPLGVGAGSLAILSALAPAIAERTIEVNKTRFSQYNGLTVEMLTAMVRQTRESGYAHTKGEVFPDVGAIGWAIKNTRGDPIAALNIATTVNRLTPERVREMLKHLKSEAAIIEKQLD
jgi:DNA-binding IclR family transcriptional regulator